MREHILGQLTGPADGVVDNEMVEALVEGLMAAVKDGKVSFSPYAFETGANHSLFAPVTSYNNAFTPDVLLDSNDPDSLQARLFCGLDEAPSGEVLASVAEQLRASWRHQLTSSRAP
ncbi:hypothetical protein HK405_004971 [Cladochytrium tenue]|nr:hypothetical protein HK405_004971 [Cladochytrium tenue]